MEWGFSIYLKPQGNPEIPTQAAPILPQAEPPTRAVENGKGLILMALGMFFFSAVDTTAKFLTADLHPVQIVWARQLGLVAGALWLLVRVGPGLLRTEHLSLQILRGVVAVGSATLFIFAIRYVPIADAVAISFVAPFMVSVLGAAVLREPVGVRRWSAVAIGFAGALIVLRPGMGVVHPAALLVILAAFLFACRQIISRWIAASDRTGTTVAYTGFVSIAVLSLALPFFWRTPTAEQVALLAVCAVLAGLAEVCVIKALELSMAVVVAPVQYTLIVWATFYGFVVFGDLPDRWTWVGTAIIVATGIYTLRREYLASRQRRRKEDGN
jgi:S-adenosylmethionine uptake transporter